ncbi:pyruvate kinase [Paenibacillus swuensis]|uniref:Pyruvate kinase n=1 Tax=Paenibacillus swuensis TaxID=1178515 RepID=A0A172TQA6_9BACL|nr:pyruvate kinase [Paenibacillus swuensis]
MRKTKIVCTIGPSVEDPAMLKRMLAAGMDVARLNMAHGSHEEHGKRVRDIRQVCEETGDAIPIMMDIKGPEVRVGVMKEGSVLLIEGTRVVLTTERVEGDSERIPVTYSNLAKDVHAGATILIDDGLLELRVERTTETEMHCLVVAGGVLKSKKNLNVPGVQVRLPNVTEQDVAHVKFGVEAGIDMIAASFVRSAQAVLEIRELLERHGAPHIQIISKIENHEGVERIQEIIAASDGVMVARGDLGVQLPSEEIPIVQKEIIRLCNEAGKPVITATQMLDSMQWNPRPTRAEASDVANAILDGTDAVMLSGESAAGKYPLEAVGTMVRIALEMEGASDIAQSAAAPVHGTMADSVTEAVGESVARIADALGAKAILTHSFSGFAARMTARQRPNAPIVAVTPSEHVRRCLRLVRGVIPVLGESVTSTDNLFRVSIESGSRLSFIREGDTVVITAGIPTGSSGSTNLIKVHRVGEDV